MIKKQEQRGGGGGYIKFISTKKKKSNYYYLFIFKWCKQYIKMQAILNTIVYRGLSLYQKGILDIFKDVILWIYK